MPQSLVQPRWAIPLLLLFSYPLFFHGLAERDLWSSHEARAGQNARVLLETSILGLPRLFDGRVELQKPPLFYWVVAGLGWLRGSHVDAWDVRLPSACGALGCVLLLYLFGWLRGRPLAGLLAGLMLATMVHFTWMSRVGRIDMLLTLSVLFMLISYFQAYQTSTFSPARSASEGSPLTRRSANAGLPSLALRASESPRTRALWLLAMYAGTAVSILLKGPVGLVLVAAVAIIHLLIEGELLAGTGSRLRRLLFSTLRLARHFGLWWGVPLVLALVLPWFLWANQATQGEFFQVFFVRHNLQRGLGGDEQFETHAHPWWFYFYRLAVDLQPWSTLLPLAIWQGFRRGLWRADALARFGFVWLATMTLLLTMLGYKRADYLLPAYAGAALLLAAVGERWLLALAQRQRRWAWRGACGVLATCVLGWLTFTLFWLPRSESERENQRFAAEVRRHAPRPGLVILFRVEGHGLVYHLERPFNRIWEWENLDIWACQPVPVYVVMPEEEWRHWRQHLETGQLYRIVTNSELAGKPHADPLVLLCTRPVQP